MAEDRIDDAEIWRLPDLKARKIVNNAMGPRRLPGFPKAIKLGDRAVGWYACEVRAWLKSRPRVGASEQAAA